MGKFVSHRVLGFVSALALLAGAPALAADLPDTPRRRIPANNSDAGETHRYRDQQGDEVFAVVDGFDLDQYLYRSSNPLDFSISLAPDFGPVDEFGHPTLGNPLVGAIASLTIRAYDVDEDGIPVPERDLIVVNGIQFQGVYLHGANDQWRLTTILFPAILLKFRTAANPTGRNDFQIVIDSLSDVDNWAVQIDWAELRLGIDPTARRPTALLHGLWNDSSRMDAMKSYFETHGDSLAGRVIAPNMTFDESINENYDAAEPVISDILATTGADRVNLVGYSLGGFSARKYAADHSDRVDSVVMLGTPNGGTRFADIVCDLLAQGYHGLYRFGPKVRCDEGSAVFDIQRPYIRDIFNKVVHDAPSVSYLALAGDMPPDIFGPYSILSIWEEAPNDGLVAASSVEYLRLNEPNHPGLHRTHSHYALYHRGWVDEGSPAIVDTFCVLYPNGSGCPSITVSGSVQRSKAEFQAETATAEMLEPVPGAVPAGGAVDIPISFEGSVLATVTLLTGGAPVNATIAGRPLTASSLLTAPTLEVTITSPTDASLHVSNSGAVDAPVLVLITIDTMRHLTVTPSSIFVRPGEVQSVEVILTHPEGTEQASLLLTDSNRVSAPVTLVAAGPGRWTGQFTPTVPGFNRLSASITGSGTRFAGSILSVSSGAATLSPGFDQRLTGMDDGMADALVLTPTVSIQVAGRYRLAADLVDGTGATVGSANAVGAFDVGSQTMDLAFDGRTIFKSGRSGPYRLVNATLARDTGSMLIEDQLAELGLTDSYDFRIFQHFPILFDLTSFADQVVDATGDGDADLVVTAVVSVDYDGSYAMNAGLTAPDGTEIARFQEMPRLSAGVNTLTLVFDGNDIANSGRNGPYTVVDLSLYPLSGAAATLGYLIRAYTTPPYKAAQFGHDATPPTSSAGALPLLTANATISIPFSAHDDGSGVDVVELWVRSRLDASTPWSDWTQAATSPSSPFIYTFPGEGDYEFYTIAVDRAGNREAPPATADAATRHSSDGISISVGDVHGWFGLRNGDDQGTQFDLSVELLQNGNPVASGIQRCITGMTVNPSQAKEAVVRWAAFSPIPVASGNVLAVRLSARIGTKPDNTKCSGHNSAIGVRFYYDSTNRKSRFPATIGANPSVDLYLHSDGAPCKNADSPGVNNRYLNSSAPAAVAAKCKDTGTLNFAGGNPWVTLSTWSLPALP